MRRTRRRCQTDGPLWPPADGLEAPGLVGVDLTAPLALERARLINVLYAFIPFTETVGRHRPATEAGAAGSKQRFVGSPSPPGEPLHES